MKKAYCSLISTGVIIMKKIKLFELSPFQFFLTSMNGMVYGLFATLIISVILNQLGLLLNFQLTETFNLGTEITKVSGIVRGFLGVGIGVGIAWALKLQGLKLIGAMVIGGLSTLEHYLPCYIFNPLVQLPVRLENLSILQRPYNHS